MREGEINDMKNSLRTEVGNTEALSQVKAWNCMGWHGNRFRRTEGVWGVRFCLQNDEVLSEASVL